MSNLDLDLLFSPHSTLTLTHQLRKPPIPTRPGLPRRERPRLDGLSAAGEGAQRVHVASSLLERKEEEDLERRRKPLSFSKNDLSLLSVSPVLALPPVPSPGRALPFDQARLDGARSEGGMEARGQDEGGLGGGSEGEGAGGGGARAAGEVCGRGQGRRHEHQPRVSG